MALYNVLIKYQTVFPLSDDETKIGERMFKYPEIWFLKLVHLMVHLITNAFSSGANILKSFLIQILVY